MKHGNSTRGKGLRLRPRFLALGLVLTLAACDTGELLEVSDPARLPPENLATAAAVPSLVRGAIRDFFIAYSGAGDDAYLTSSALLSDEFYNGDTFTTRVALDRRSQQTPALGNVQDVAFLRLNRARVAARRAAAASKEFTPDDKVTFAQMRAIEAFTYVTLGEGWCGAIPFSVIPETGSFNPTDTAQARPGMPLTVEQAMDSAIVRFNEALAANPNNNLAKIGKARALLNKGGAANATAASLAVRGIADTYVFHIEHSANTASQNNPIFALISNGRYSVSNLEGGTTATGAALRPDLSTSPVTAPNAEGIAFRGLRDPRVPYTPRGNGRCFTSSFFCWFDQKNPNFDADVPLASGVEARLIEAEALARVDDARYLGILNNLRSRVGELLPVLYPQIRQTFPTPPAPPSLAPLTDPGTVAGRRAQIFQERALWMYLTGHRLGDLRRLVRDYGLPQSQVFPSGPYYRGGVYGTDVNFTLPFNEQNNPNFKPEMCVTSRA